MLHNLTQVADYKGVRFVCDQKLAKRKYAVKYEGEEEVYVSPAVYHLLSSDLEQVAKSLMVRILPRRGRQQ